MSLLFATSIVSAEVAITRETYREWTDAVRISNGTIDLVIVPQIGRIMHYGYTGKQNLLWENLALNGKSRIEPGWANYGGDKIWDAPQSRWNWPPDPTLDGSPFEITILKDGVRMKSGVSKRVSVQVTREIKIKSFGSEVALTNILVNKGEKLRVSCWQVTQLNDPSLMEMPLFRGLEAVDLDDTADDPKYFQATPEKISIKRDPVLSRKVGSKGVGPLRALVGGTWFESTSEVKRRSKYPDKDTPLQVYTNKDPLKYVELEHHAPLTELEPNQSSVLKVTWRLR